MLKPVSLPPGHSGCKTYMDKWLRCAPNPTCPECNVAVKDPRDLNPSINFALHNITRDLTVRCVSRGCVWKGTYEEAEKHYKQCPKLPVKCLNEDCQQVEARSEQRKHAATCVKRKIPCPDCNKSVTWDALDSHRNSLCLHADIQCPLECETTLPRYVFLSQSVYFPRVYHQGWGGGTKKNGLATDSEWKSEAYSVMI